MQRSGPSGRFLKRWLLSRLRCWGFTVFLHSYHPPPPLPLSLPPPPPPPPHHTIILHCGPLFNSPYTCYYNSVHHSALPSMLISISISLQPFVVCCLSHIISVRRTTLVIHLIVNDLCNHCLIKFRSFQ